MRKLISLLGTMAIVGGSVSVVVANIILSQVKPKFNTTKQNYDNGKIKVVPVPNEVPEKILVTAGDWWTSRLEKAMLTLNLGAMNPEQVTDVAITNYGDTYAEHHVPSWENRGNASCQAGINHLEDFKDYFYEKRNNFIVDRDGKQVLLNAMAIKTYGNNNWNNTINWDLARHYASSYVLYTWEKDNYNDLILNIAVTLEVSTSWTSTKGIATVYVVGNINIYYN
ncbi:hypothetical protein [Spiroplasma sp. SV19]|uniref:hypothetical protein n=1 Tax=Spiroplasma sp. SV19 TaxID=2570468 RepID=UPI0024B7C1D0|nr:hypothetical protein [Spiroplasma sp. SV19]WHQ36457.1 hypothetical protein E7Y35_00675 [Spiroplasma sp. SV19]